MRNDAFEKLLRDFYATAQLKHVERDLDRANEDLKEAEKNLEELKKCCGLCICPCSKDR